MGGSFLSAPASSSAQAHDRSSQLYNVGSRTGSHVSEAWAGHCSGIALLLAGGNQLLQRQVTFDKCSPADRSKLQCDAAAHLG